jgi:hypothetical protein
MEACSCSAREVVDRLRRGDVTPLDLLSVLGPPVRFASPLWPLNVASKRGPVALD